MTAADYQIEASPAASGAQGTVYFGTRIGDGLAVAVKVAADARGAVESLHREIEVLQALAAEGVGGVVPCLDTIEHGGKPALVMPRYPHHLGDWLNAAIASPGPRTLKDALRYTSSVAYSLGRIHRTPWQGGTLVHRDVKPENVFLDEHGAPWLGDFGGAMAIGGLERVELTLFGTPMWAPLDQILPGQTIPDPTWDTYALCVFLYAAITGARPAYQSDPRTLLTQAGGELWEAARRAIEGPADERAQWARHFARMRTGATAADLVDVTGHGALVDADRAMIDAGVARLGDLCGLDDRNRRAVARGLWDLLARGLSPVSHPSPPNRFRDGVELGELVDDLSERVVSGATPAPARSRSRPPGRTMQAALGDGRAPPPTTLRAGTPRLAIALGVAAIGATGAAGWLWRDALLDTVQLVGPAPDRLEIPPGVASIGDADVEVPAFAIDRLEAAAGAWTACVQAEACDPSVEQARSPSHPATGLSLDDARALCAWRGGRVPTEAEWMRAYGDHPMPWGDAAATCDRAVALGCRDDVAPVGSARAGASPFGVEDLAGNASEWVLAGDGGLLIGGDVRAPASRLGRAARGVSTHREPLAGVRCVYPPGR